ncbi:ABC transporter substrate-binding protein [Alkalihalobacillus sp. NPDC078783]
MNDRFLIAALVLGMTLVAGCTNQIEENPTENTMEESEDTFETSYPLERKDALGRDVVIEEEPQSIVSLIPSNTEIIYALDAEEGLVGRSEFDDYPTEVQDVESIGGMEFDVEKIIELEPDLILAHQSGAAQAEHAFEQLDQAGYPVFIVDDAQTVEAVYDTIEQIGELLNKQANAEDVVENMANQFQELAEITQKQQDDQRSVWIEISSQPIFVAGTQTFLDELLSVGHAKNAADDQEGWVELSEEIGITYNPDVIISTYDGSESIKERPAWDRVKAVEENRVFDIDANLVSRPGPRLAEGAWDLAELVYPEDFE